MSDRIAAAEAILATLTIARTRVRALATEHLPFDRALALELRATVGVSAERTQLEWTSALLDGNRALWRAVRPPLVSGSLGSLGAGSGASQPPVARAAPSSAVSVMPLPVRVGAVIDEEIGDEDTHAARPAPGLIVIEPGHDDEPEGSDPGLGDLSDVADQLIALTLGPEPAPDPDPYVVDSSEAIEEPDTVAEPAVSESQLVRTITPAPQRPEPEELDEHEASSPDGAPGALADADPATEESLTEEASEEPPPTDFDYLVRFVPPPRTPAPEPEPAAAADTEGEDDGGLVLLSEDDISAPEEDELLDEAMEKALDGDEPSVVGGGGGVYFGGAPDQIEHGFEDGGTEGPEEESEPPLELSPTATVISGQLDDDGDLYDDGGFDDERTTPAPDMSDAEMLGDEPSAAPPPRREAPRAAPMAFAPVARVRSAPEFNPALEVAAEETDELLSPEPEEPVARTGAGFTVTLERPGGPEPEEEYEDAGDDAPPVNAPRLTDETESYDSGFESSGPAQPEVDTGLAAEFLRQARDAEVSGNLSKAIMFYQDLLDLTPENMDGYLGRGRCFMEMGDYAAAMSDFQRAEDLDTRSPEPLVEMGNLFFARKEYRRAIEFYDQAIELDPTHAMARCRRGICHHYRKNHKQAFQDLQRAYSLNPEIPNIRKYVQMAVKAMEKGR